MPDLADTALNALDTTTRSAADRPAGSPPPSARVLPAAVLWDMDGTLIDSEPFWIGAELELAALHGAEWTHEDGLAMVGNPMTTCAAALRARGVDLSDEEICSFLNSRVAAGVAAGTPWQPGAQELLSALVAAQVPMALVTSSHRELADPFVRSAGVFDISVCGDEVAHPKPDPEPYLTAAARLGVDIADCVAFEDSPAGIASAVASGAHVVAVEVMVGLAPRPGVSRVRSLADVTLDDLARVLRGERLEPR
ncbi:HAD family hydrolase [Cellulomonas timonensis]|uniref:HAD family hydrolase n=1 Tax=Cellulomonas timonensis TaxID=1689271 RepID=UPI001F49275E|nr:HAD family phosphatase [Cellulomonas timonensis]